MTTRHRNIKRHHRRTDDERADDIAEGRIEFQPGSSRPTHRTDARWCESAPDWLTRSASRARCRTEKTSAASSRRRQSCRGRSARRWGSAWRRRCSITHGIHSPITSCTMAHMENVPDMAIFTPVQTTTIAARPRHRVLPALRIDRPVGAHNLVHDLIQIPFEVVADFRRGCVGRDGRIDLLLRQGGRGAHQSSAARAQARRADERAQRAAP